MATFPSTSWKPGLLIADETAGAAKAELLHKELLLARWSVLNAGHPMAVCSLLSTALPAKRLIYG